MSFGPRKRFSSSTRGQIITRSRFIRNATTSLKRFYNVIIVEKNTIENVTKNVTRNTANGYLKIFSKITNTINNIVVKT